ncbi:hypothetical protein ABT324_00705 [Saccharopolyspora sp. NPDC000359]|uniref:hypothetical protein n=1 Tax=Saccharopolyspora sp. NPDC000359 TaxID=3154251 RepID=UPI00331ACC3C
MTTTTRSRSEIGRANNRKGKNTERRVVAGYLRESGWPDAERKPDPGWRSTDRACPDLGDIRGTDRLVWQVKDRTDLSGLDIVRILAETAEQAIAAGADYGIVIQRCAGKADPGRWWAWLPVGDLAALVAAGQHDWPAVLDPQLQVPARVELADLVPLLHAAGYGTPEAAA